jgi:hypothetical protein
MHVEINIHLVSPYKKFFDKKENGPHDLLDPYQKELDKKIKMIRNSS